MATLFNRLQQTLSEKGDAPQPMQKRLESMLRAKTGKATTARGPGMSGLGEAAAIGEAKAGLRSQQMEGKLSAARLGTAATAQEQAIGRKEEGLASQQRMTERGLTTQLQTQQDKIRGQEQEAELGREERGRSAVTEINNRAEMGLQELAMQRNISLDNIFSTYERSSRELAFRKDAAELEQRGFELSMRDKAYLDKITMIAQEQSLENEISFKNETERLVWGENLQNFKDQMNWRSGRDVIQADWQKHLASIDIEAALQIGNMAADSTSQTSIAQGAGTIAAAGIKAKMKEP